MIQPTCFVLPFPPPQARAEQYVSDVKKSPDCWQLCLERFSVTTYQEVKFWCLQTLHDVVKGSYTALEPNAQQMVSAVALCNDFVSPAPALSGSYATVLLLYFWFNADCAVIMEEEGKHQRVSMNSWPPLYGPESVLEECHLKVPMIKCDSASNL